jgi:hypothetical protein
LVAIPKEFLFQIEREFIRRIPVADKLAMRKDANVIGVKRPWFRIFSFLLCAAADNENRDDEDK